MLMNCTSIKYTPTTSEGKVVIAGALEKSVQRSVRVLSLKKTHWGDYIFPRNKLECNQELSVFDLIFIQQILFLIRYCTALPHVVFIALLLHYDVRPCA